MVTESLREIYGAATGDGRTSEGVPVFVEGMTDTDKAIAAFTLIVDPFVPGTLSSGKDAYNAYFEKPNRTTGKPKSLGAELVTNLTGARFTEFDPSDALMYKIKEYNRLKREIVSSRPDFSMTADDAYERQINRQKALYEAQQDLYEYTMAAETLLGRGKTVLILTENDVTIEEIDF